MKTFLLALTLPLILTGCATYVGATYGGPGYPGYYDGYVYGGPTYVGYSTYNRGYYHHGYHHYDTDYHRGAVAYHGAARNGNHNVASVSHTSGHSGGEHRASASAGR